MLTSNQILMALCIVPLVGCNVPQSPMRASPGPGMAPLFASVNAESSYAPDVDFQFRRTLGRSTELDLQNPSPKEHRDIIGATAMLLICDTDPQTCDKIFSPSAEFTHIPIHPHCGKNASYSCTGDDNSFKQFNSDHYVEHSYSRGTASFISNDIIITARHNIKTKPAKFQRTYVLMNLGHRPDASWEKVTDHEGAEFLRVETKYILAVTTMLHSSGTADLPNNDWATLQVAPLQVDQTIPPHPQFCVSTMHPKETRILVPAHPRALPLKIADGFIVSPGDMSRPMEAVFDVAKGSSGGAVLLADFPTHLIGINRGSSIPRSVDGQDVEVVQECDWPDFNCTPQPVTPSVRFRETVLTYKGVQPCP